VELCQKLLLEAKGFADRQIAHMMRCLESQVHTWMTMNINRVFKLVDTCAQSSKQNTLLLLDI
jgi:carbamoyl-phosphate synthase large subunit